MTLNNDIVLNIATGLKANSKKWTNKKIKWSAFAEQLSNPVVTSETYRQYLSASKAEQTSIKDVGGFVGGFLTNGKRGKSNVLSRQLLTLDIDFGTPDFWFEFTTAFNCSAVLHSTHKSNPDKPRYRLIIPLDREVTPEEYQAIGHKVAELIDIELFDQTTFDVNRLMFFPSVSSDAKYEFELQDGEILSADSILEMYEDWHDTSEWATPKSYEKEISLSLKQQEDPLTKRGIVGVFCRTYTIAEAIEEFLPDVYESCEDNRYTYMSGTTAGGLIVYDGKFAYSYHNTDPAGNRLCNAFDLVRIHKFGHLDANLKSDKADVDKRSYKAMEGFAAEDKKTKIQIAREKFEEANVAFSVNDSDLDEETEEDDDSWVVNLKANTKGEYENSASNVNLIIKNDKNLKKAFKLNLFDNKRYVCRSLPWREVEDEEPLRDVDYSGVRNYIECTYGISASQKIDDALALEFEDNSFHPIKDYISGLTWDGTERIDTLLIDYFGAVDNEYTRASIRKMLVAAVARVFNPGVKFDLVLILVGAQGTYKSTFIRKLGKKWSSDTFTTLQGKDAFEQLQGAWIIEMAELSGLRKAEIETIKHFISKQDDSFRPAYGRVVETYKRQCVFFGTTNSHDFLRDATGNRRFMPVEVNSPFCIKSVPLDFTDEEVDQVWAEAYQLYLNGETLYLNSAENALAVKSQKAHEEEDSRFGVVQDFLERLLPKDWQERDLADRLRWLNNDLDARGTEPRTEVCLAEIWCECFGNDKNDMTRANLVAIREIMSRMDGWERRTEVKRFSFYGVQRYYKKINL